MKKTSKFFCLFLLIFGIQQSYGQSLKYGKITSASASSVATNGSLRWSLGELNVGSLDSGTGGSLQQGHQWIVKYVPIDKISSIDANIQVFPNPSTDYLTIQMEEIGNAQLLGRISTLEGRVLKEVALQDIQSTIDVKELSIGIYLLTIVDEQNSTQSIYKLIKQ